MTQIKCTVAIPANINKSDKVAVDAVNSLLRAARSRNESDVPEDVKYLPPLGGPATASSSNTDPQRIDPANPSANLAGKGPAPAYTAVARQDAIKMFQSFSPNTRDVIVRAQAHSLGHVPGKPLAKKLDDKWNYCLANKKRKGNDGTQVDCSSSDSNGVQDDKDDNIDELDSDRECVSDSIEDPNLDVPHPKRRDPHAMDIDSVGPSSLTLKPSLMPRLIKPLPGSLKFSKSDKSSTPSAFRNYHIVDDKLPVPPESETSCPFHCFYINTVANKQWIPLSVLRS